ncbi:MAG: HDOD domain-containing protein [Gammaproteobacteria bacterium]|nr:HDOD domain-containing protein [Gammaproteobacteria bacterium]
MNSRNVQGFLDELYVRYVLHANVTTKQPLNFSAYARSISACPIKAVLFADERGPVIAAFNAEDGLAFDTLSTVMKRQFSLDPGRNYKKQLHGFSIRHLPPLGRLYQIPMVIDEGLIDQERYLMEFDGKESFIEIDKKGFKKLIQGAQIKHFTKSISERRMPKIDSPFIPRKEHKVKNMSQKTNSLLSLNEVKSRFNDGVDLPVIPTVAQQLIFMKSEEKFELLDLVHLIESDPVISAKIISYANSPFFSYEGKLETVQEAVYHVLGVDISLNISLALALGQEFNGPMKGPLGASSIWRHAVYCGVLSQSIATKINNRPSLKPGTAYLFGLLHNIGYLALGQLYKVEFKAFNKAVSLNNDVSLKQLEMSLLGVTHADVGMLLMKSWGMPMQYALLMENHHNGEYNGEYREYVNIVYIANLLLKRAGIGDAEESEVPRILLEQYNLDEAELTNMLDIVMGWHDNLDHLAHQLAA